MQILFVIASGLFCFMTLACLFLAVLGLGALVTEKPKDATEKAANARAATGAVQLAVMASVFAVAWAATYAAVNINTF